MGAGSLALVFSQKTFEMFQPGVLEEAETPAERRMLFAVPDLIRNFLKQDNGETGVEVSLPVELLDCLPGKFTVEQEDVPLERQMVKDLVNSLTPIQMDIVRRVLLETESINTVAQSYGRPASDAVLSLSCALDEMQSWGVPCIDKIVEKGRALGYR